MQNNLNSFNTIKNKKQAKSKNREGGIIGKPSRFLQEDIFGGLSVAALGMLGFYATSHLDLGTLAEIGPGLFPWALAIVLLVLCATLLVLRAWRLGLSWHPTANIRALCGIFGAILLFAMFMRGTALGPFSLPSLGVTGATPLAILFAGFADNQTRWKQLVMFAAALTAFCTVLFRFLLGLPLPVAPWLIGY